MGEVIHAGFVTTLDTSPDRALEGAHEYGLESVVIVGFKPDGEFYFASSQSNSAEVIYLLEKAKHELLKMEDHIAENGDPHGKPRRGV